MKAFISIVFIFFSLALHAQEQAPKEMPDFMYWTKHRLVPRIGAGAQDSPFAELGLAYHSIYIHPLSLASSGSYLSVEGVFQPSKLIVGPKCGYNFTFGVFGMSADVTYYTDFSHYTFMATPKAGMSVFGFMDIYYGYNFPLSPAHFTSISTNRFSLTFNLNRDYFNLREAPRRNGRKMPST